MHYVIWYKNNHAIKPPKLLWLLPRCCVDPVTGLLPFQNPAHIKIICLIISPAALIPQPFGLLWTAMYLVTEVLPPHLYDFRSNCNGLWSTGLMPRWVCHIYLWNGIKVTALKAESTAQPPQKTCARVVFLPGSVQARSLHATSVTSILNKTPQFYLPPAGMQLSQIPRTLMVIMPAEIFCACFSALQEQSVTPQHLTKHNLWETKFLRWLNSFRVKTQFFPTSCTNTESNQPPLHAHKCNNWVHKHNTLLLLFRVSL